jgi:hypothetical protein
VLGGLQTVKVSTFLIPDRSDTTDCALLHMECAQMPQ